MGEAIITLRDVSYKYPRTNEWVLKNLNLEIEKGDFVAVLGGNGAGKTTFCQLLNGVIPHSHGGQLLGDVHVAGLSTKEYSVAGLSTKVGMVLEDPETQIFTTRVFDEVAFGQENLQWPAQKIQKNVNHALSVVRLQDFAGEHPSALSGGQKQRLAVAAAIAMQPDILVLDEPTSQLDPIGTSEVFDVLEELKETHNITVVMATHKGEEVARVANKALVIKNGKIAAYDTPHHIFKQEQLLRDNWIRPPQVSELANTLSKRGKPLGTFPITSEEAVRSLKQWKGGT